MKSTVGFSALFFSVLFSFSSGQALDSVGICSHLIQDSSRVQKTAEMGAKSTRLDFNWNLVEPSPGHWDFSQTDAALETARTQGLSVYASIGYTPAWASANGNHNGLPDPAAWENFVRKIVTRYKDRVEVFGIWNEPNLDHFFAGSAEDYVNKILKPAGKVIRSIDPQIKIAGPDLAHLYSATISPLSFLKVLKDQGGLPFIDILSYHIYGGPKDFEKKINGFKFLFFTYKDGLVQFLNKSGIGFSKPVWITEFGISTNQMSEDQQGPEIARQLTVMKKYPWIKRAYIFEVDDNHDQPYSYGVLRADGSPKPSFFYLQNFLRRAQ